MTQKCFVSPAIDRNDTINEAIIECWQGYLKSRPDSIYDNPYWNNADKKRYVSYDLLRSEGYLSPSLYHLYERRYSNEILQIESMGDEYAIHSMFYFPKKDGSIYPLAITKVIAKKDQTDTFKLHNWLEYYTRSWYRKRVGVIQYVYTPTHPFNQYKAEQANRLITALIKTFGIKVDHVDYYIASSCSDIYKLKGFEDVVGMHCTQCNHLCGFTDRLNNIIYSNTIEGEYYSHELMRLINKFFPNTSGVFINGLAAYVGGANKAGLPITEHFRRMDAYLNAHPEITDIIRSWSYMDETTAPIYYIGALICQMCLEKGGLPLLREGMAVDSDDEAALNTFFKEKLDMPIEKQSSILREKIHEAAVKGFVPIDFLNMENK
jgi:hypothetical protein